MNRPGVPERDPYALRKKAVRRSFDVASGTYEQAAVLQREIRHRLLERLDLVRLAPKRIVDLGAGTGQAARVLGQRYPDAEIIAVDLSAAMLQQGRPRGWRRLLGPRSPLSVCADAERLPLRNNSCDLVISNLMLQWCDTPDTVFAEVRRVLNPGGLYSFTTFGPDTLTELRSAWAAADDRTHVHRFMDMHDIGDGLVRARLADPVLDVERHTLTYATARDLMLDLKAIGARNAAAGRPPGLTGRRTLKAVEEAYESRRKDGVLPATYEVVFGQAWGTATSGFRQDDEVRIPLQSLHRKIRNS